MRKTSLGIATLAMTLAVMPMNAQASNNTYCQTEGTSKVIVWNGSCEVNDIISQIQNNLGDILGNYSWIMNGNSCTDSDQEVTIPDQGTENESTEDSAEDTTEYTYAQQVVDLVNAERAKEGLSPLTIDANVTKAANVRAVEIQSSFSHTRPDGNSFYTVLNENGVSYKGAGENIAYGQRTPEEVVTAWMNSAGHRANIMNESYTNIGIGYQVNNGTAYWVQLFTY